MKKLTLSLTILLYAILAQSQTTVFNIGWSGTPEKILCAGDTWIVYGTESQGPGLYGNLSMFKKKGNEFEQVGVTNIPEQLEDFRFANGKLHLVAFRNLDCDYYPKDLYYYEVDTATFRITKYERIGEDLNLIQAGFSTDSTIFIWTDDFSNDSIIHNVRTGLKSSYTLAGLIGAGDQADYVQSILNDKFLFIKSSMLSAYFLTPVNVSSANLTRSYISPPGFVREVYPYSGDSMLVITDQGAFKLDTNFNSHKSISLPSFSSYKVADDKLYFFDDYHVRTFSLPGLAQIFTDSLKGLPSGFEIKDVYPTNGNLSIVAHRSNSNPALNETVLKSDINSTNEVERNEIMLDSVTFVKADVTGLGQANRYLIRATNHGQDTIKSFNVLFEHLENRQCFFYDHTTIRMPIPPGESRTFTKDVRVHRAGQVCFFASVPDGRLEDNLSDNSTCAYAWLSTEEVSNLGLVSIYPNPANRKLTIKGDLRDFKCLSVRSIDGRQMRIVVLSQNEEVLSLDMTALKIGVYFLQMHIGEEVFTEKIVKE